MTSALMWSETDYCTPPQPEDPTQPLSDTNQFVIGCWGKGAAKLSSSAVAPLVAAARGYCTLSRGRATQALADHFGGLDTRSKEAQQIKRVLNTGDALMLPWFGVNQLSEDLDRVYAPRTTQLKPDNPEADAATGKLRKYVFAAGGELILDLHPSTPFAWLREARKVAIVEGLLKADSFLTAFLIHNGIDPGELSYPAEGSTADARQKLRNLLEQIEPEDAVLVVSVAGVTAWHKAPDWNSIQLRERDAYVAFDGDTKDNHNVWAECKKMFEHLIAKDARSVQLIDLSEQTDEYGEKAGVDDVLAGGLSFADLMALTTDQLPPEPPLGDEELVGKWRVNESRHVVEECVIEKDDLGNPQPPRWVTRSRVAGRVTMIETSREPNDEEMKTGEFNPRSDSAESTKAEFELSWIDEPTGNSKSALVLGPDTILEVPPKEWHKQTGITIPAAVKRQPDWPMSKCGDNWLTAVKEHRAAETDERTSWARMGWVPTSDGAPVFIVGDQVVGADGDVAKNGLARPGVTEAVLTGASSFGVQFPKGFAEMSEADRKRVIREDILKVKHAYLENGAWTDPGVAAAVLAAMIRPCVPLRTKVSMYVVGPRAGGKSFTASFILSGWQPEAGIWSENKLSGAAKDTMAATEHAVSRTPIWVVDDLAPSTDPNQANQEIARMGDLIRSIHNGTSKRRMTRDMTSRHVMDPHALLVVTAENEHPVSSVRDRVITLRIRKGSLGPDTQNTAPLVELRDQDGAPARVVGYILSYLASLAAQPDGWKGLRLRYETEMNDRTAALKSQLVAQHGDQGAASRHSALVADLGLGLSVFGELGEWAGIRGFKREMRKQLLPLAEMMAQTHANRAETSPGAAAVQAVSRLLASGRAHISGRDPMFPPFHNSPKSYKNTMLGWIGGGNGEMRPQGPRIGTLVEKDGEEVVLLDSRTAFDEAAKAYRDLLPHGSTAAAAWTAADDEGLLSDKWKRASNGKARTSIVRVTVEGVPLRGVPVLLDLLLRAGIKDSDDPEEDDDSAA